MHPSKCVRSNARDLGPQMIPRVILVPGHCELGSGDGAA